MTPILTHAAGLIVDHVTVAGRDLKKMQSALQAAGLRSEFGGAHNNHATQMALTSFPDGSYLELIAIQDRPDSKAVAAHYWSKELQNDGGPAAWAVRTQDAAAEVARLKATGIAVTAPVKAGRDRPDGVRLDWETANVGSEPNGTFFPFMIRDFTPREKRAFPQGKPTTSDFNGVKRVVIAVRDLNAAIARYRKAYGLPEPARQADAYTGGELAAFAGTPVVLVSARGNSWVAKRLEQFGEGPCAFILSANNPGAYQAAQKSRWFGSEISWFDAAALGWHLGFEQ